MYIYVNIYIYIYIVYGKLDMGCILFHVLQLFPFSSPAGPLAHINTFCVGFFFPFKTQKYIEM